MWSLLQRKQRAIRMVANIVAAWKTNHTVKDTAWKTIGRNSVA